jgi:hypothetical protein
MTRTRQAEGRHHQPQLCTITIGLMSGGQSKILTHLFIGILLPVLHDRLHFPIRKQLGECPSSLRSFIVVNSFKNLNLNLIIVGVTILTEAEKAIA